jgi:hypothetical protein
MQNTSKPCSRCGTTKTLDAFALRAKSSDGYTAACRSCINQDKQTTYWLNPEERAEAVRRVTASKQARFARDPAYKRAFHLWGSAKKRTKIPPWVSIVDFVPICRKAIQKGPEYELDHIVPVKGELVSGLHVPSNLRVVKRSTNQRKQNRFDIS